MRHPFDVTDDQRQQEHSPDGGQDQDRRAVLGKGLAIAGGVIGLGAASEVLGQRATTLAIGEEGGRRPVKPPVKTTKAIGEEGGRRPVKPPVKTTMAIGEEGGGPVTRARGEAGGPIATTMAIGEEGGKRPPVRRPITTARYEEGSLNGKSKGVKQAVAHLRRAEALKDEGDYIQAYRQIEQTASCNDASVRSLRSRQLSSLDYTMRTAVMQADKDLKAGDNIIDAITVHIALGTMPKLRYAPKATKTKLADLKKRGEYASAEQEIEAGRLYRQAQRLVLDSSTAVNTTLKRVQTKAARDLLQGLAKSYPKAPSTAKAAELLKSL